MDHSSCIVYYVMYYHEYFKGLYMNILLLIVWIYFNLINARWQQFNNFSNFYLLIIFQYDDFKNELGGQITYVNSYVIIVNLQFSFQRLFA